MGSGPNDTGQLFVLTKKEAVNTSDIRQGWNTMLNSWQCVCGGGQTVVHDPPTQGSFTCNTGDTCMTMICTVPILQNLNLRN